MPAQASTATQPGCEIREREAENIWEKLRRQHFLRNTAASDSWRVGSPAVEAAALFRLLRRGNGYTVESLRQLIAVSPADKRELMEWAALSSPSIAVRIDGMIAFREEVLAAFDRLVENEHRCPSAAAG